MKIDVWAETDVGLKREINQDSILVDKELGLYIVADGMGGHKGGEVASAMAVETVQEYVRDKKMSSASNPKEILIGAYRSASAKIHNKSTYENPELMGMGTTMVGVLVQNGKITIANVGDSRAYLYRSPLLWQLTEDHSLINEQVRAGVISEADAPLVVGRNVITRSVGFEKDVQVDIVERKFEANEVYLLCSDGLSSLVNDEKIAEILKKYQSAEAVSRCIAEAKRAGGDDNISVVMLRVTN